MATSRNPFFFVVSSSEQAQPVPCFSCLYEFGSNRWYKRCLKCHPLPLLPLPRTALSTPTQQPAVPASIFFAWDASSIFVVLCLLLPKKRLGNAEIRLSLGTCFRQEAKLLACRLFALLHASLPGVPDLPTLRHILVRHLSSMQGKDVSEYGKRGPRKTALPCSFPQPPVMTVTNSMEAGDAKGFTAPSFACDRQPAYPATRFTPPFAKKPVCQDTCLHPLSQPVAAKISPLSTARFSGKHVAAISPDGALASPSVTSCSAENSIRTDHPHGMLCPDTLLLLCEERFR